MHKCAVVVHTAAAPLLPPARLSAAGVGSPRQLGSAPLRSAPLQGCRAAQLLTDREMRGGDAGWGHKQGEAEEEKAERESPALEYTATTRRQREGETQRDWLFFGGSKGSLRRCGYELKKKHWKRQGACFNTPKFYCKG